MIEASDLSAIPLRLISPTALVIADKRPFEVLPDRGEQDGADAVPLAHALEFPRLALQPGPFEGKGYLVDEVIEQVELTGGDGPGAIVAGKADGAENGRFRANRKEYPFGRIDCLRAAPGRLARFNCPGGHGDVAGRQDRMGGPRGDDLRRGSAHHQHGVAVEQSAKLSAGDLGDLLVAGTGQ